MTLKEMRDEAARAAKRWLSRRRVAASTVPVPRPRAGPRIARARRESSSRVLLESIGDATLAIASELEMHPLLQTIADEARRVAGAEFALLRAAASDRSFEPCAFSGTTRDEDASTIRMLAIIAVDRTVRLDDLRRHPAFSRLADVHPKIVSLLAVPIRHQGQRFGSLYLANKRDAREFTEDDARAIELIAAHAGAAIRQSSLHTEMERVRIRFSTILESAPHGIHFVEAGTEKVIGNRRAHQIAGQEDIPTLSDYKGAVCTPEGKVVPIDQWPSRRIMRHEPVGTREMLIRTPDGRDIPVLVSAAPVFRANGELDGSVVVYEDISQLKELQSQREEWASIVTHDLRQPLNVIATYIQMLRRMADIPDKAVLARGLGHAERAANALSRMITDLTDVSTIEANRLQLQRRPVDLVATVRDVVENQQVLAPDRHITLCIGGALPELEGDPVRIAQVLTNLLVNAVKYSDAGTPVDVEVQSENLEARVVVRNRGPGIAAEDLPKLFQRHYRTARARASGAGGLGLGLYIARAIVEAQGGRIWAESWPGDTTTFQFTLPVTRG